MGLRAEGFEKVRAGLVKYSESQSVELGVGLLIGLVNYSRHIGVCDLEEPEVEYVLLTLG